MKEMADLRVRSAITLEECRCVLLKHADLKILSSDWTDCRSTISYECDAGNLEGE